jgi:hypothetical protein
MGARTKKKIGLGAILLHTILTLLTGGLWLIVLLIIFLRNNR